MIKPSGVLAPAAVACVLGATVATSGPALARPFHLDPLPTYGGPQIRLSPAELARSRTYWQPMKSKALFQASTALLMTDGTVLVQGVESSSWFRLTPDKTGSYINGTWTPAAAMPSGYGPLYYSSAVLPDGRLIVNGGEYNVNGQSETNLGAIYDNVLNKWTPVAAPSGWSSIGDAPDTVLANGTLLMGRNCCSTQNVLLDASTLAWAATGSGLDPDSEQGYSLLPSGQVLAVDVINNTHNQTEIYNPATGTWAAGPPTVNDLIDHSQFEIGAQVLRPNGDLFVEGGDGNTGIYNTSKGTWSAGPSFKNPQGQQMYVDDGPAALLQDGNVLCVASTAGFGKGSLFFEFNGTKLIPVPGVPSAPNSPSFYYRMLELPNGQVLMTDGSTDVEIYTHVGAPHPFTAPKIQTVSNTLKRGTTYPLTGVHLNGFSQGAAYGDDAQMATNYPIVRITNAATGHVFYARTHDHSSMAVASPAVVSTMFDVPATMETGASSLVVVANGTPSAPVSVTVK